MALPVEPQPLDSGTGVKMSPAHVWVSKPESIMVTASINYHGGAAAAAGSRARASAHISR